MVGYLKSLQVLKWGNLDLSCITRKVTVSDSKYAKLVKLIISCKIVPLSPLNHICDRLKCTKSQNLWGSIQKSARGVHSTPWTLSYSGAYPSDERVCCQTQSLSAKRALLKVL